MTGMSHTIPHVVLAGVQCTCCICGNRCVKSLTAVLNTALSQTVAQQNKLLSKIHFSPQVLHSLKHMSLRALINDEGLFQITSC